MVQDVDESKHNHHLASTRRNVPLAPLSTFGIGGSAEWLQTVSSPEELIEAVKLARKSRRRYKIIAGGSNVVFPDSTLRGVLVRVLGGKLELSGNVITADAGVPLRDVIDKSIRAGLKGLETLSGIPGTIGGAVVGNAGAYGHSIREVVERVEIWDGRRRHWIENAKCDFAYRESVFKTKPWILLRIKLRFEPGSGAELKSTSRAIIKVRLKKYKPSLRCPGSFFKNVLVKDISKRALSLVDPMKIIDGKIPAGYLLEEVGAKGMQVGGIRIASFHANLFFNYRGGRAADVRKLARALKSRVRRKFGITLEEEVRYF